MSAPSFASWLKQNRFAMLSGIFLTSTVITGYRINQALARNESVDQSIDELDLSIAQLQSLDQQKQKRIKEQVHAVFAQPLTIQSINQPSNQTNSSSWTRWLWPVNWFKSSSIPLPVDQSVRLALCDSPIKLSTLQSLTPSNNKSVDQPFITSVVNDIDEIFHTGTSEKWLSMQQSINQSNQHSSNQLLPVTILNAYRTGSTVDTSEARATTVSGSKTASGRKIMV